MNRALILVLALPLLTCLPSCGGGSGGSVDNGTGGSGSGGGTGAAAGVLHPSSLNFEIVTLGNSATQPVVLTNDGDAALEITGVNVASPFSQTNNCPSSLASQDTCTINVTFKPSQTLSFTGTLTVSGNGTNNPQTASLSGVGGIPSVRATSPHPGLRTRYLRTDAEYDGYPYFPAHLTTYDAVHKRFFMSNPTLSEVLVFDAATESQIGSFVVPTPWGLDVSPDGSQLWVASYFGDVYLADPVAMQVVQRYPSAALGTSGFSATEAFALANGEVALLGPPLGLLSADGNGGFAIWNPLTNDLQVIAPLKGNLRIGQMALSADRTKVILTSADSDGTVYVYDTTAGTFMDNFLNGITSQILPTPDGSRIFLCQCNVYDNTGNRMLVIDANTLQLLSSLDLSGRFPAVADIILGYGGGTFFIIDNAGNVTVWSATTFKQLGWVPSFGVDDAVIGILPGAVDETNLIVGPIGHGAAFLDGSQLRQGNGQLLFSTGFLSPGYGSVAGGTKVQSPIDTSYLQAGAKINSGTLYVGNGVAGDSSVSMTESAGVSPAAAFRGAADFTLVLPDGSMSLNPEDFSYGPTIVEVSPSASTAEGGGQGILFGYGLGQNPTDVRVSIGGRAANVTQVLASPSSYPFPMETVFFTVPPGTAGAAADVTVNTSAGATTASGAFHYLAPLQPYPLGGVSLNQGIYDPHRGLMYFSAKSNIQVFSLASNSWQAPMGLPGTDKITSLTALALSADGNSLAVSDPGDTRIYLLNPDSPGSARAFSLAKELPLEPCGIAVANTGTIYYATYDTGDTGDNVAFHSLNTTDGSITDIGYDIGLEDGGGLLDEVIQVAINPDQSSVYLNYQGDTYIFDIATGDLSFNPAITLDDQDYAMSLSADGTVLATAGFLTDQNLNEFAAVTYVDRDTWTAEALGNQQLNKDGSLLFQPLTGDLTGIDVLSGTTGLLQNRITFVAQIAEVYDALVMDTNDNLLFIITTTGISRLDLNSLPTPAIETGRLRRFMKTNETGSPNRLLSRGKLRRPSHRESTLGPVVGQQPLMTEHASQRLQRNAVNER
jgi:WD40 repeat protein